jgi:hypothetical protein
MAHALDPAMSGASDARRDDDEREDDGGEETDPEAATETQGSESETEETDVEALRRQVEAEYDFDDFGPADMAQMSAEEWEVAFDPETWITGEELLDRVEADLKQRVADRDVFARIERHDDRLLAYSDTGYATVYADGSVEGRGTVLRDVKPTVALCSMESYDVPENPPEELLPEPQEVPEGSGALGNTMLQVVAAAQVLAGVVLVGVWLLVSLRVVAPPGGGSVRSLNVIGMLVAGFLFLGIGVLLFVTVANARLSDKFRAEEYRNRLRAVDLEPGERPEFLPEGEGADDTRGDGDDDSGEGTDVAIEGGDDVDGSDDAAPTETADDGDAS